MNIIKDIILLSVCIFMFWIADKFIYAIIQEKDQWKNR